MAAKKQWSDLSKAEKRNGIIGLVIIALVVFVIISTVVGSLSGRNKSSTPAVALGNYANASQIVQALKTHNVPCNHVITETTSTWWAGEGATSGVWVETAPGDSAAQFGGSENAGTDTEIVVFKNHTDAIAYVNLSHSAEHQLILGTNWAIDAASSSAARIHAALGGTLTSSTAAPSAPSSSKSSVPASKPSSPSLSSLNSEAISYLTAASDFYASLFQSAQVALGTYQYPNPAGAMSDSVWTRFSAKASSTDNSQAEIIQPYNTASNLYTDNGQSVPDAVGNWQYDMQQVDSDYQTWVRQGTSWLDSEITTAELNTYTQAFNNDLATARNDISQIK